MRKVFTSILTCCFIWGGANAQISVTDGLSAQDLAQELVGQGVVILNPTINGTCPDFAGGKFNYNGNPSDLGIDSGIVLTSGRVVTTPPDFGVNAGYTDFASNSFPPGFPPAPGDPQLDTLININSPNWPAMDVPTNDACVLEFDFIPAGDTIKFQYVFASEEYNYISWNYNCSINDVFGFFISGPGYSSSQNIALVPGTNPGVMVGVSTVNDGTGSGPGNACDYNTFGHGPYTQYYNDNAGSQTLVYSGYTDVFTARASVIPCDTYHLKLAIADASDAAYDSGVFLKAGSLNSVGIDLDAESTHGHNTAIPHCIRGCKDGRVKFSRPNPRPTPLVIKYIIDGTAVNGVDYQQIADSIVIPANEDSAILNIKGLLIPNPSGPKTVVIKALSPYQCGNGAANIIDTATITIFDSLYAEIITPPTTVCPNTEVPITAEIDTILDYEWAPAALIPDPPPFGLTIHPKPTVPTIYSITVRMPGAPATCPPVTKKYLANVEPVPDIILPSKDTTVCLVDSMDLTAYARPEGYDYIYKWSPATHLRNDYSAINKFYASTGDYQLTLKATTPVAGCSDSASMMIHVVPPFTFTYVTPDTTIKYGDSIRLNSEGDAIYWLWSPITDLSDPTSKDPLAFPKNSTRYTLIGINQYGCRDTAEVDVNVEYESISGIPNAFSPNGDGLNDVFKLENIRFDKVLAFRIYNRWGKLVFETDNVHKGWDGTINGSPAPTGVYYYYIELTLPGGIPKLFKGSVALIR